MPELKCVSFIVLPCYKAREQTSRTHQLDDPLPFKIIYIMSSTLVYKIVDGKMVKGHLTIGGLHGYSLVSPQ